MRLENMAGAPAGRCDETSFLSSLPPASRVLQRSLRMPGLLRGTWGRGILLRGVLAAARHARAQETEHWRDPLTSAHGALRAAARRPAFDPTQVNHGPLWLAARELQELAPDPFLAWAAESQAVRLAGPENRRVGEAISHLPWPGCVWADTPYMVAPLLARVAVERGRGELAREAVGQVVAHARALERPDGLLGHSVWPAMRWLDDRTAWARGNGWVLGAAAEVIEILGPDSCARVVDVARRCAARMAARQHASGLWPVLLDEPAAPLESSSAALAARAMLCLGRRGIVTGRVAAAGRAAAAAVLSCVDDGGWVRRSQGPTLWSTGAAPSGTWPWTQGLVLLMAAEMSRGCEASPLW
jgi:rhamnogalacturonyl hydrolase YesR